MKLAFACLAALLAASCHASPGPGAESGVRAPATLRLATWNLEWLVAPESFLALKRSCVPQGASPGSRRRSIPCDVAAKLERSTADFEALARYARELDADVVAMQEVDGPAAGRPFAVLGDFNRELLRDPGPARNAAGEPRSLWAEIDDGDPPEADLVNAAESGRFVNCHPGQNFNGYIDHILLSRTLAARRVPGSFRRITFEPREALRHKLTDHCPVAVDLALPQSDTD